jgi:regulatory protein
MFEFLNGIHNGLYYTYIIPEMSSIYERAVKLLKIRPHHSEELVKKLTLRGFNREEIEEVIVKLQEENFIDNDAFAQMYLDSLLRFKTFGFYGLKSKLMSRGIASNEAEKLLKENLSTEQELEIAGRFLEKQKETDKNKLAQKLSRKGFRIEVIRKSIT